MSESVIFIVIAVLAILMGVLIVGHKSGLWEVDFFRPLYRSQHPGTPELMRYDAVIADGVLLGKGGELIATFKYRGPDVQCSDENDLAYLRTRMGDALRSLDAGWLMHATMMRRKATDYPTRAAFPDAATRMIDAERRHQYRTEAGHFVNDYYVTFTFKPPTVLTEKVNGLFFTKLQDDKSTSKSVSDMTAKHLAYFEERLSGLVGNMESALGRRVERLRTRKVEDRITRAEIVFDDQLAFLHACISGEWNPVRLPSEHLASGVDFILGAHSFRGGLHPMLDGKHIRVIGFDSPPDGWTHFGMMDILNNLKAEVRFTTRWEPIETNAAIARFEKRQNMWGQKALGIGALKSDTSGARVNHDAVSKKGEMDAALKDLHGNEAAYGYWCASIVLMHEHLPSLDSDVKFFIKNLTARGFRVRDEGLNCVSAYFGSLPGERKANKRAPEIHTWNLVDLMMLTSVWEGLPRNPCSFIQKFYPDGIAPPLLYAATSGGTPFALALHAADVGHSLVVGPTGSGKSVALSLLVASHFRYPNARVVVFDKGESMLALCMAAGGTQYNFFEEDRLADTPVIRFAPFSMIDKPEDVAWANDYVASILTLHGIKITAEIRRDIAKAINLLASNPVNLRTMEALVQFSQNKQIKEVLALYVNTLADGMLNGSQDTVGLGRFTMFEVESLMNKKEEHSAPVLLYVFRMIERALDGSPTMIVLDEAWLMFKNPLFAEKIEEWLRVLRKQCAQVVFATQDIQSLMGLALAPTILGACQIRLFLANPAAMSEINLIAYTNFFGLPRHAVDKVANLTLKREYLFVHPNGMRIINFEIGAYALCLVAVSEISERREVKKLVLQHGKGTPFLVAWLRSKGLNPDREFLELNLPIKDSI